MFRSIKGRVRHYKAPKLREASYGQKLIVTFFRYPLFSIYSVSKGKLLRLLHLDHSAIKTIIGHFLQYEKKKLNVFFQQVAFSMFSERARRCRNSNNYGQTIMTIDCQLKALKVAESCKLFIVFCLVLFRAGQYFHACICH